MEDRADTRTRPGPIAPPPLPRSLETPWAGAGRSGLLSRVKESADEGNRGADDGDGGPGARGCERARARPPKNN